MMAGFLNSFKYIHFYSFGRCLNFVFSIYNFKYKSLSLSLWRLILTIECRIMLKTILIISGSVFLGLGFLGIFTPGLPTTPFLLLAAGCYVRSSERLYSWLLRHRLFGKYIKDFRETRSIPLRSKIISLILMWAMIGVSVFFLIDNLTVRIIISILGLIGTLVLLSIPTSKR